MMASLPQSSEACIRVACLLPKRNNGKYYPQAFKSLCTQSTSFSSILICENHSTDGSSTLPYTLARGMNTVSVISPREPARSGGESLLYCIIHRPKADFYHIASSDDVWLPNFLSELTTALSDVPTYANVSAVFCDRIIIDQRGRIQGASGNIRLPKFIPQKKALEHFLCHNRYNVHGAIFREDVIAEVASFAKITGNALDHALMIEASRRGDILYVCKPLYKYRRHPFNTSVVSGYDPRASIYSWIRTTDLDSDYVAASDKKASQRLRPSRVGRGWHILPMFKYMAHRLGFFLMARRLRGLG